MINYRERLWEVVSDSMSGGVEEENVKLRFDKRFDEFIDFIKETINGNS